ncbi:MAG: cupin domain-containing protein [Candidatus Eremiobacteraeota bacterium]|nr:cupin domain-containing protein [Candidatus Eremiobacteraeota bacterium]
MMLSRSSITGILCALVALGALAGIAVGQTAAAGPTNVATEKMPITVTAGDYELVNQVLDFPPGSGVPSHTHGGPVALTVLSGELTVVDGTGTHILKAGQSGTEKGGYTHSAYNKGTVPVRVAVSYLIPKGAPMTTMAK